MTTIEGGMVSTNNRELFDVVRMLRSHGLVRESLRSETKESYYKRFPDLDRDFIFAFPSHNMRPTELNGILGLSQLKRLDANNKKRTANLKLFLSHLDSTRYKTDFRIEGSSNYAFTVALQNPSFSVRDQVEKILTSNGIEFRRGLSGGGNQLRQPYLQKFASIPRPDSLPNTDFVHQYGWYIGNYPNITLSKIEWLCEVLNSVKL